MNDHPAPRQPREGVRHDGGGWISGPSATPASPEAALQADWPLWEVWTVHKVVCGTTWCARRHDDHKKILNADSPGHLAEYLEEAGR